MNYYDNLVQATQQLVGRGYNDQFVFENGQLLNTVSQKLYTAEELTIIEYHRFEGITTSSDSAVIFAIETEGEEKGTLVMNYSTEVDMDLISFIDNVKIKTSPETVA